MDEERSALVPWRAMIIALCMGAYPFLAFLAGNRREGLSVAQVAPYALALMAFGSVAIAAIWFTWSPARADRAAVVLAGAVLVVFNYAGVSRALASLELRVRYQLVGWALLLGIVVVAAWWASRKPAVREWVLFAAILLVAIPLAQFSLHRVGTVDSTPAPASAAASQLERTPDIYFIVPDGYARADRLDEMFGFDNSSFLNELVERGFVVADNAYANYSPTYLSIPSTLEMNYVIEPGLDALAVRDDGRNFDRSEFYNILRGSSAVVRTLRNAGYRHVQAPPGTWGGSQCSGIEDLCVEPISETGPGIVLGELEWALLELTPVASLSAYLGETFDDVTSDPVHTVREIGRSGITEPVFAFIHMLHTHPPFRFSEDCGPIQPVDRSLTRWRGNEEPYLQGVECANRRILAMLDMLPQGAIVVIQSDHGSKFRGGNTVPVREWTDEQIMERLPILSAVRLPHDCRGLVDDRFGGVNTFRVVLACLSGQEPDLLPQRHMLAGYREDPEVLEVELP